MTYIEILQQLIVKLDTAGETEKAAQLKKIANTEYTSQAMWIGETSLAAINAIRYNERLNDLVGNEVFDLKMHALDMGLDVS
ncbi:MAG: hypothetical protein EOP51_01255 [Sphingobacteriales bacterium]|nr:MAG: hypothetical protein EOP51_01255 [Sphingobacteriales bacterium]